MNKKEIATPTNVSPINWRESFSYYPCIIINAKAPIKYRIICRDMSDDGGILTIQPSLNGTIDEMLKVLEGCLMKESNFRKALEEYYGSKARFLNQIKCDFNGIQVVINDQMSAWDSKQNWLRDGLNAGYKNMVIQMTLEEKAALEEDAAMKEIIARYRKEL